ncbi:MAG: transcriptional repressor [Pseudomonadota bacterium]
MGDAVALFRAFVAGKKLRNTPEREEIIREIFAGGDHFDVDEIYLRLRRKGSRVSKASIYRNIPLIMECGLIREVWYEDGHMHYEPVYGYGHHCHLRCKGCGKVIDFVDEAVKSIEMRLGKEHGFQIVDHRLDVVGYCADCRKTQADPKRKGR